MFIFRVARFQKEEALKFRITKAEEVIQAEKVLSSNLDKCLTEYELFSCLQNGCEASCLLFICIKF